MQHSPNEQKLGWRGGGSKAMCLLLNRRETSGAEASGISRPGIYRIRVPKRRPFSQTYHSEGAGGGAEECTVGSLWGGGREGSARLNILGGYTRRKPWERPLTLSLFDIPWGLKGRCNTCFSVTDGSHSALSP